MHRFKTFLMGLLSVVFVCGAVALVFPIPSEAKFKKKQSFPQASLVKKLFQKTVCGFRNPDARFVTSKDGKEVCDRTTGNIWEQNPASFIRRWDGAKAYCAELDKGHGTVYELPTIQQLVSVLNYTEEDPALTPDVFDGVTNFFYWSASEVAGDTTAWGVFLTNGVVRGQDKKVVTNVWCVRRDKGGHGF